MDDKEVILLCRDLLGFKMYYFCKVWVAQTFIFSDVFCRSTFILWFRSFMVLYWLSLFDLRHLIISMVS